MISIIETGMAITEAIATKYNISLNNITIIRAADAPFAFRIAISLVLREVLNEERPNKPRHDIRIQIIEKILMS